MAEKNEKQQIIEKIQQSKTSEQQKEKLIGMADKLGPEEADLIIDMLSKNQEEIEKLAQKQVQQAEEMAAGLRAAKEQAIKESQEMINKKLLEIKAQEEEKKKKKELKKLREELK